MDLWSSILISAVLVVSAIGLMVWHVRSWRDAQAEETDPRERDFRRRQHRRRMQTSAMLGILGVAILAGQLLTPWVGTRLFAALYWGGVLVLTVWMALLAVADIIATQQHYSRLRTDYMIQRAKLQAELRRVQAPESNGRAKKND